MNRLVPAFLCICASVLTAPVGAQAPQPAAAPVINLYEGRVPVTDQSSTTRETGLRAALGQVIQQLGGSVAAADSVVARAPQLVQRYGYEVDPATRQLQLVAAFDPRAVDAQLRALNIGSVAPEEEVRMTVAGIDDAQDYARVVRLLKSLPGVSRVQVTAASGSQLDLRLRAQGGSGRISGALFASGSLTPDTPAPGVELAYRLR